MNEDIRKAREAYEAASLTVRDLAEHYSDAMGRKETARRAFVALVLERLKTVCPADGEALEFDDCDWQVASNMTPEQQEAVARVQDLIDREELPCKIVPEVFKYQTGDGPWRYRFELRAYIVDGWSEHVCPLGAELHPAGTYPVDDSEWSNGSTDY